MADRSTADAAPKLRGFLIYAVGEIVLVVIGILIALQIGEWAETRNEVQRFQGILREVRIDLEGDIREAGVRIDQSNAEDSLLQRVLAGEMERSDYLGPSGRAARRIALETRPFAQRRGGWERLQALDGVIPDGYEDLMLALQDVYVDYTGVLDTGLRDMTDGITRRHAWLETNTSWYWRWRSDAEPSEEMIGWYLEDETWRNFVAAYEGDRVFRGPAIGPAYRKQAIFAWTAIGHVLGEPESADFVPDGLVLRDPGRYEPWLGEWPDVFGRGARISIRFGMMVGENAFSSWGMREIGPGEFTDAYGGTEGRLFTFGRDPAGTPTLTISGRGPESVVHVKPDAD